MKYGHDCGGEQAMSDSDVYIDGLADGQRASEQKIAELEEAIRVLADTVVVFWTSADFVRHSDSLSNARKNPIVCRAIDETRSSPHCKPR